MRKSPSIYRAKIHIFITTYNRPNQVLGLIRQIISEARNFRFVRLTVIDDCSTEDYRLVKETVEKASRNQGEFIVNPENFGKRGYWKTYNSLFQMFEAGGYDYMLALQDDMEPCEDFLHKAMALYLKVRRPAVAAVNLFRESRHDTITWYNRATRSLVIRDIPVLKHYWIDGAGWISRRDGLPSLLNFRINEVSPAFWSNGHHFRGSGVFPQISNRVCDQGCYFLTPSESYLRHAQIPSQMHAEAGKSRPRESNFIDDRMGVAE